MNANKQYSCLRKVFGLLRPWKMVISLQAAGISSEKKRKIILTTTFLISDGLVRVFTNASERAANPEILQTFEEELAATSLNAQLELGGIKASE